MVTLMPRTATSFIFYKELEYKYQASQLSTYYLRVTYTQNRFFACALQQKALLKFA